MKISIDTEEDFDNVRELIDSVNEIAIGLALSKEANLERIFKLVVESPNIKILQIYDDYLYSEDRNTKYFLGRISEASPDLQVHWISARVIDGRHGR